VKISAKDCDFSLCDCIFKLLGQITINKTVKRLAPILGGIILVLLGIQLFIQQYSAKILEDLVTKQSKGKVKVEIGRVRLRLLPNETLELHNTIFIFNDLETKSKAYSVEFKHLSLQLTSIRSFIMDKKLLVDYLLADQPIINIHNNGKQKSTSGNHSLNIKIGNVYLALKKIVNAIQVKKFGLKKGSITLHDLEPYKKSITLGNINIILDELKMADKKKEEEIGISFNKLNISSTNQNIEFPEGDYRIQYGALEFDTEINVVKLDDFKINSQSADSTKNDLSIEFKKLRLRNIDFNELYTNNRFKADSVICTDPIIKLDLDLTKKKNTPIDGLALEKKIAGLIGNVKMKYLGLINSNITVQAKGNTSTNNYNTKGNNFIAYNVAIDSTKEIPIEVGKLQFAIKNYDETLKNGKYKIQFDSVVYDNMALTLLNFKLSPTKNNTESDKKYFTIPQFKLEGLGIYELILEKYLKAKELTLTNATFINNYHPKKNERLKARSIKSILSDFSEQIDLETIRIINGKLQNKSTNNKSEIIATGIQSEISVNEIFDLSTYESMASSIEKMNFDSAVFKSEKQTILLKKGQFNGDAKSILAEEINITTNNNAINAKNIRIHNYQFNDDFSNIIIDSIFYEGAKIQLVEKLKKENNQDDESFFLRINHLDANNTDFSFASINKLSAKTSLKKIKLSQFKLNDENEIKLDDLDLEGDWLAVSSPEMSVSSSNFSIINNRPSFINKVAIARKSVSDTLEASFPKISFTPAIANSLSNGYPILDNILLDNASIFARQYANPDKQKSSKKMQLDLGSISLNHANLDLKQQDNNKSFAFQSKNIDIKTSKLNITQAGISIGRTDIKSVALDLITNDSIKLKIDDGAFGLQMNYLNKKSSKDPSSFNTNIQKVEAKNVNLISAGKNGKLFSLTHFNLGGENIILDSASPAHILRHLKANPTLFINNIDLKESNTNATINAFGIGYRNGGRIVTIDSFQYAPTIDRETFMKNNVYQKDHMQFSSGKITIRNFDIERIATDSNLQLNYITIEKPFLQVYKDKRLPLEPGKTKGLPAALLKKIKQRMHIDSVRLVDGNIVYEEFNDKTEMIARINLSEYQSLIRNIKNYNITQTDSLYIVSTSRVQDTAEVSIRFHESYADSIGSFLYRVRFKQFGLPALNSILLPTANMKIDRGWLDTLDLRVMGNDYLAHGKMRMYYKDFKIQFLSNKELEKRTIFTKALSWLANTFLRTNNVAKTGTVFTERTREKSFVNYWVKIVLSGAMTNTRIRKNSKQEKRYQKALKRIQVPELPAVDF
jgi:hypothetical protein